MPADSQKSPGRRLELIAVLAILSAVLLIRAYQLGCDPPAGLSVSTDAYTDPPQYTLFAKLFVQTGEFNPFEDHRLVFFLKSSVTLLATAVYSLFGVSLTTMGLLGLLFSLGALLMFYLFVRRLGGPIAAMLFLLIAGLNFNLVAYGRFPFLEHPMAFFAFLSLVLVSYFTKSWVHLLGGLILGIGVFFGKVMGVAFLAAFACYYLVRLIRDDERFPRVRPLAPILFGVGYLALAGFWYAFSYQPYSDQVTGYLQEQSLSLYGAPEAFDSIPMFIEKFMTFGADSDLFARMPLVGLLGALLLGAMVVGLNRRSFWRGGISRLNAGHLFLGVMIVAFVGGLMIWNYRPLRYQLVLIYPFAALATLVLVRLWEGFRAEQSDQAQAITWWSWLLFYPLVAVTLYQLASAFKQMQGRNLFYGNVAVYIFILAAVVVAALFFGSRYRGKNGGLSGRWTAFGRIAVVVVLVANLAFSLSLYLRWVPEMSYSARDLSKEIDQLVSPEAVLSGPFGPLLTMQNDLPAVIHMFGVSTPDPELFKRFPITHLLLDEGNEERANEDYPLIMRRALHLATYRVGRVKVRLFKIAGLTGNRRADAYPLSLMERSVLASENGNTQEAIRLAAQYGQLHPDNITCNLFLAEQAERAKMWPNAEFLFKKAVEFSPTSYVLYARLGKFYASRFEASGNPADRTRGLEAYQRAMTLAPDVYQISADYRELQRK